MNETRSRSAPETGGENASAAESAFFTAGKVAGFLALMLAAAFYPVLFGGKSFFYRDFGVLAIPTATYHHAAFWSGQIPLWNPFSNCGAPFLAQWGPMVCYPLDLIYLLLPLPWSLNFFCVAHLWLGGMGMYFLARRWLGENASWPAAAASIAFVFNGIAQASVTWPNYTAALGLMPWVIFSVEEACGFGGLGGEGECRFFGFSQGSVLVFAALISAGQLLAGVPEISLFTWLLATALLIRGLLHSPRGTAIFSRYCLIVLLAAGLVAMQILPFYELLRHSQRAPGFADDKWALPAWGWADFLLPRFHTFKTAEGTAFQYGQEFLGSTYIGAPLFLLALFGAITRSARARLLAAASLMAAILALGSSGWLYPALTRVFPFLGIARYPVKFVFVLVFTVPLLAGYGAQYLRSLKPRAVLRAVICTTVVICAFEAVLLWFNHAWPFPYDRWNEMLSNSLVRISIFVVFILMLCGVLLIASCRLRGILSVGILLLFFADALSHLPNLNPVVDASVFAPRVWTQTQNVPKPALGSGRVFITPQAEEHLLRSSVANAQQNMIGKRLALWSHLNLLDFVPKVNGSSTLQVAQQAEVQKWLYDTSREITNWLDFLNVTLKTSSNSVVEWTSRKTAMPFVTGGQKAISEPAKAISAALENREFDPRKEVILNGTEFLPSATQVEFSNVKAGIDEVSFDAKAAGATVAVISQTWYPAWKYSISGSAETNGTVIRANFAFQAVPIPAGASHVRVYYHDRIFRVGSLISVVSLLVCVAILFVERRKPRPAVSHK
jgi:hypothetical protein